MRCFLSLLHKMAFDDALHGWLSVVLDWLLWTLTFSCSDSSECILGALLVLVLPQEF